MTATGTVEVTVPDIGDFADVPVIEILVGVGDTVALDDPLVTLESDKATMDVPAPAAGKVLELLVAVGDRVSEGTAIMRLEAAVEPEEATTAGEPAPAADVPPAPAPAPRDGGPPSLPPAATNGAGPVYASPSVRRAARELGVDLSGVAGTGRKGRITREDIERVGAGGEAPGLARQPELAPAVAGAERVALSRIQRISAAVLARNWAEIPHVTQHDEADITDLEAWRKQLNAEHAADGVKVTMVAFLVAASVATLKAFPRFNSSLDGEELIVKGFYNIGFAADTPGGLLVPVIKNAEGKGLLTIARELSELSARARAGKLGPGEMSGGTFTISSLGGIGGTGFTPIINAPEVAILGVTRAAIKPVWDPAAGSFQPRLMLPLSLSYDHRVIDGAAAARFVVHLAAVLSDLRRALL